MEMRTLTVERRQATGKEVAKKLRQAGRIPAVLYGGGEPLAITADPKEILRLMHGHEGGTQLLQVSLGQGGDTRMAIVRNLQFDPVSERLIHVDLQQVAMDKAIQVSVPVRHEGDPVGVRESKGILEMITREVLVSCLPGAIPEFIVADVSGLGVHDVFTVGQLVVPEGVRILTDVGQALVTVSPPMVEEEAAPAAAAAEAEPEVLSERKPKDEEDEKKK